MVIKIIIWKTLGRLKPNDRAVVVLRYIHGFSGAKTAEILGWPHVRVRVRLNTALRRLREFIEADDFTDPPDHPQHPPGGPDNHPSNGHVPESILPVPKRVRQQIGAAGEQPVGREL